MNRRLHHVLAWLVGLGVVWLGAWLVGQLVAGDYLAIGIGILWGVVVGMCLVVYGQEVVDREPPARRRSASAYYDRQAKDGRS